jgi:hypothetical protein
MTPANGDSVIPYLRRITEAVQAEAGRIAAMTAADRWAEPREMESPSPRPAIPSRHGTPPRRSMKGARRRWRSSD